MADKFYIYDDEPDPDSMTEEEFIKADREYRDKVKKQSEIMRKRAEEYKRELTNEAAEMIGQYIKGGKEYILSKLLKNGGIVNKEIDMSRGRKKGLEPIKYFYSDGNYAYYDPARARAAQRHKEG